MQQSKDIRPTGTTNVRLLNTRSRKGRKIAIWSFGCILLMSVLFGLHSPASAASAQASTNHAVHGAEVPLRANALAENAVSLAHQVTNAAYGDTAWQAALDAGIDPNLFIRQINQESGFDPNAYSPAGAEGIAQFMPATATGLGVDPWDPTSALYGAANLMAQLSQQFGGNYAQALAAYNAGPGTVQYAISVGGSDWYDYLPAETQSYVTIIMGW